MVLRAALDNPRLAFLLGATDTSDYHGVDTYAAAGNDVFDHEDRSYAAVEGWNYTSSRLAASAVPFDEGLLPDRLTKFSLPPLPFGTPTLLAIEGPVLLNSTGMPDAYMAWGNGTGHRLNSRLPVPGMHRTVYTATMTVQGVMASQAIRLDGLVRTTFTLIRAGLQWRNKVGSLSLYCGQLHGSHERAQRPRIPDLPSTWARLAQGATEGMNRHCRPFVPAADQAEAARQHLRTLAESLALCTTWQEALGLPVTSEEFRLALEIWAPRSGFRGTPYKQIKRLAEAHIANLATPDRELASNWWHEIKGELMPKL